MTESQPTEQKKARKSRDTGRDSLRLLQFAKKDLYYDLNSCFSSGSSGTEKIYVEKINNLY
jgi:hypothetical protein